VTFFAWGGVGFCPCFAEILGFSLHDLRHGWLKVPSFSLHPFPFPFIVIIALPYSINALPFLLLSKVIL
jgi:hypothetical protein